MQCVPSFFASREVAAGCHHWLDSDRGVVVSLITRAHFNPQQLALDSTWTISVYGTPGTLYAVLIAFVVTGVWQSFSAAETAVNSEANALTDLVFLIRYISAATTSTFARRQDSYVASVVERWEGLATREDKTRRGDQYCVVERRGGRNSRGQTRG